MGDVAPTLRALAAGIILTALVACATVIFALNDAPIGGFPNFQPGISDLRGATGSATSANGLGGASGSADPAAFLAVFLGRHFPEMERVQPRGFADEKIPAILPFGARIAGAQSNENGRGRHNTRGHL